MPPELVTVGDKLRWSYANLAMAHAAVSGGSIKYDVTHFKIRARLFKGLNEGTMSVGPFADDERLKMILPQACCYCGAPDNLSLDHVIPRKLEGGDGGDNLVWACRSCNSSKGAKDLLVWYHDRGMEYPPILLLRRYLKLVLDWCETNDTLDVPLDPAPSWLPFAIAHVPGQPPAPSETSLWITESPQL